jgi:hypothetical protein
MGTALGALEIAGSLCGVPYVGAAAIVLRDIVNCCNQVVVQKVIRFLRTCFIQMLNVQLELAKIQSIGWKMRATPACTERSNLGIGRH